MKKIGLFGGSFNPIHNGHVQIGRTMLRLLELDEVWYMVSPQNPWKQNATLLSEDKRLEMARLALENDPRLVACDYEFRLPRPSYTWATIQSLMLTHPDTEWTLIIGGDNWAQFTAWRNADDILRTCRIAVFPRQGAELPQPADGRVSIVHVPLVNVTSTQVRDMVRRGEDISHYVPHAVKALIETYYRNNPAPTVSEKV